MPIPRSSGDGWQNHADPGQPAAFDVLRAGPPRPRSCGSGPGTDSPRPPRRNLLIQAFPRPDPAGRAGAWWLKGRKEIVGRDAGAKYLGAPHDRYRDRDATWPTTKSLDGDALSPLATGDVRPGRARHCPAPAGPRRISGVWSVPTSVCLATTSRSWGRVRTGGRPAWGWGGFRDPAEFSDEFFAGRLSPGVVPRRWAYPVFSWKNLVTGGCLGFSCVMAASAVRWHRRVRWFAPRATRAGLMMLGPPVGC